MPSALKFREVPVTASRWTPLSGAWLQTGPVIQHQGTASPNSFNFFVNEYSFRDGAVEATLRVSSSQSPTGRLLFRRTPRGCYYAGIGGYRAHFVIAKFIDAEVNRVSVRLATAGNPNDIRVDEPYELRVEFVGEHIVLKSTAPDGLQLTLRFSFRAQLTTSVRLQVPLHRKNEGCIQNQSNEVRSYGRRSEGVVRRGRGLS
jgi:hypothetical protein